MISSRRTFLKRVGTVGSTAALTTIFIPQGFSAFVDKKPSLDVSKDLDGTASDEDFWYHVQKAFLQSPHFINLEAGYFSPQPQEVMEAQLKNIEMINEQPSYYMRRRQHEERLQIKRMIAEQAGVSADEIVITRNTTESLNTVILGYPWEEGDEAIVNGQDYPNMLQAFWQAEKRYGIKTKDIVLPLHPDSDEEIVRLYEEAITSRTKVILCTHMINITGQIQPVSKICDMAHSHGVEVIVDGAHTFAHLDFKIPELHCDYYGASLHKWLCCPLGLGLLYIKEDRISKLWPLFGDITAPEGSITKFERVGTRPVSANITIASALKFHNAIGSKRKEERLRYLKDYWCNQVKDISGVRLNVPLEAGRSCAIANVAVEGVTPDELARTFYDNYRIFTVAINNPQTPGVRVTPHLYTRIEELDLLADAIKEAAAA